MSALITAGLPAPTINGGQDQLLLVQAGGTAVSWAIGGNNFSFGAFGAENVTTSSINAGTYFMAAGNTGILVASGVNQVGGSATLVGGTIAVANTTITENAIIILTRISSGGTVGNLSYTITPGTGFTINSLNALDTSTIGYFYYTHT